MSTISGRNINSVQDFKSFIVKAKSTEISAVLQKIHKSKPGLFNQIKTQCSDVILKKLTNIKSNASNEISLLIAKGSTVREACENLTPTQKNKVIKTLKNVAEVLSKILENLHQPLLSLAKLGIKLEKFPVIRKLAKLASTCTAVATGSLHLLSGLIKIIVSDDDTSLREKFAQAFKLALESIEDALTPYGVKQENLNEFQGKLKGKLEEFKENLENAKEKIDEVLTSMKEIFQKIIGNQGTTEDTVPV
jgi:methyl-accepting chemotaxis protein